ncbi:transcriptional regulator [Lysinibacillus sp. YS11]|uniref:helix-turn-helix domain-containing protein n=1 Tax=Lysinibacillus TaxID=400634 RepID=UPI000CA1023F|nr:MULTISPECIES: helix-turn-helix transcriptional regulator [Lysinibacillus]AUS86302.1 transcriptional regulator [Lysinibacillus sp. YS11]MCR6522816.1 helix-turn-helix domain-containing protein [Lysinibacillus capsici]MEC1305324.1 helix-turn-helix transcriptional regulator [Lysinibacillus capsici]WNN78001.1 helix-turn-helix transcriptional regulator [Lysinibacillus capsici]
MDSLGTRIRKLRKEQKLTLEALAGDRLTKGMLSQIENDKAKPSMESLDYIAERLGVKASELLEEVTPSSIRQLLEQVESLFAEVKRGDAHHHQEIVDLIKPSVEGLPQSYEAGRLLYIYADAQYEAGLTTWEVPLQQARTIFKEINLLSHWFKTFILEMAILAAKRQYTLAYDRILQAKEIIEQEDYQLDSRDALLMTYYTSIFQLAIGEHEEGKKLIQETIANAHKNQLFYQIDNMYRIGAYCAMIDRDFEQTNHMFMKLEQYQAFAERVEVDAFIFVLKAHYCNNYSNNYEQALMEIERFYQLRHDDYLDKLDPNFYYAEKGKSLYLLGQYEEAKAAFEQYKHRPIYINHPYDILSLNECFSYKALCYAHFGELTTAYEIAKMAYTDSLDLVDLPYKRKIEEVYRTIKAQIDSIT